MSPLPGALSHAWPWVPVFPFPGFADGGLGLTGPRPGRNSARQSPCTRGSCLPPPFQLHSENVSSAPDTGPLKSLRAIWELYQRPDCPETAKGQM